MCAQRAGGLIAKTVVRAGVNIDQVLGCRGVEALVHQLQLSLRETVDIRFNDYFDDFYCLL